MKKKWFDKVLGEGLRCSTRGTCSYAGCTNEAWAGDTSEGKSDGNKYCYVYAEDAILIEVSNGVEKLNLSLNSKKSWLWFELGKTIVDVEEEDAVKKDEGRL